MHSILQQHVYSTQINTSYTYIQVVSSYEGDLVGINQILYTRTGQLMSIGNANDAQFKLWDSRSVSNKAPYTSYDNSSYSSDSRYNMQLVTSYAHPPLTHSNNSYYTSFTTIHMHPSLPIIYCGTNTGNVIEYDLRLPKPEPVSYHRVHTNTITSIRTHPENDSVLYTSSLDGSVRETLWGNLPVYTTTMKSSTVESILIDANSTVVLAEPYPAAMVTMDVHVSEGVLAAGSASGCVYEYTI